MSTAMSLREKWQRGEPAFGAWAALPNAFAVELMAQEGISYICADQQHGLVDYQDTVNMYRAAEGRGVVPISRVPANESWMIAKALDAGAQGVVVPMINTGAEAAAAVAACRYPPSGVRSFGPIRAALVTTSRDAHTLGNSVLCFVMIETREGLDNLDEIAATPGLDGIYIGPADLALGLGLPPDLDKTEPEHVAAVEKIRRACQRNQIVAGIQCASGSSGRAYAAKGFGLITIIKDSALLQAGARSEILAAHGEAHSTAAPGYT